MTSLAFIRSRDTVLHASEWNPGKIKGATQPLIFESICRNIYQKFNLTILRSQGTP